MQVLSMNVLYMWLSRRLGRNGNIICLVIGGMCILPCILLVGLTTKLWQVAVANGMTGVCAGLFMGGLIAVASQDEHGESATAKHGYEIYLAHLRS